MRRAVLAVPSALVVGALCWLAPVAGVLVAVGVVLALVPTAATLVGRIGVLVLVWLSASQFSYLVRWSPSFPPRQAVAWGVVAVVAIAGTAAREGHLARSLPRVGAPEAALGAFALAVGWWIVPWIGDSDHVLERLFLGWDHSGHFAMVEQLRAPSPAWGGAFPGYPKGFHALAASLVELGLGAPRTFEPEVVAYTYASLAVVGASLLLLAAQVLGTRAFRARPLLLPPAVTALVAILFLLDDASQATYYGFVNFLEASALAGAAMLLPLGWTRRLDPWRGFLLGAAAAGIVGTWPLLLAFLVPIPVGVWLGRRRHESGVLRRLAGTAILGVVPVLAAFAAQPRAAAGVAGPADAPPMTWWEAVDRFLLLDGGIRTSSLTWLIAVPLVGVAAPLALAVLAGRPGHRSRAEARWLWPAPALAVAMGLSMVLYEHLRVGQPRYYGVKVLCASTITAGCVGVAAVAALLAARPRPVAGPRRSARVLSAVAALVLLCMAGPPIPVGGWVSPGGAVRAMVASTGPADRLALARAVRASCSAVAGRPGEYYLLLVGATREDLVRANVWVIGCGENWGSDQPQELRRLLPDRREDGGQEVIDLPDTALAILSARPSARVLVSQAARPVAELTLTDEQRSRLIVY